VRVLPSPCYIISDAHLGYAPAAVERSLLAFVQSLRGRAGSLVINGDLFEFWFEWKSVIPRSGFRILAALADLSDAGVPILMIAGNHDCWGGDALKRDAGVDYQLGPWTGELAGWRARLEHGDGLRPREDRGYRALRHVLRNGLAIRAFRWLHPDVATPLASHSSGASRAYGARDEGRGLRAAAERTSAEHGESQLIVFGHSHVAALDRLASGAIYGNAGSWLDAPTFLRVTPERIALREWNGSAESADLHAFDRPAEETLSEL
jgi:UDP-2,3-diacylglucosamine hydrolase